MYNNSNEMHFGHRGENANNANYDGNAYYGYREDYDNEWKHNAIDVSIPETCVEVLLNLIIPIYTIVMIIIGLRCFITGASESIISENRLDFSNTSEVQRRSKSLYFILLASIGCIIMTLRLLINSNFVNLIGIILIICFILFTLYVRIIRPINRIYKDSKSNITFPDTKERLFIIDYISYSNSMKVELNCEPNVYKEIELTDKMKDTISNIIQEVNKKNISIGENYHLFFFELITTIIMTVCLILTIISLFKNKIDLNVRLMNSIIVFITFSITVMYLVINIRRKIAFILNYTKEKSVDGFVKKNRDFLVNNNILVNNVSK